MLGFLVRLLVALLVPIVGIAISLSSEMLPHALSHHGAALHLVGSAFIHMGAAVVFITVVDRLLWPFLSLRSIVFGTGCWQDKPINIRAAALIGYCYVLGQLVLGFATAGV